MQLLVRITQCESGSYAASTPALPGCCARGASYEEALENMRIAAIGYVASLDSQATVELCTQETPVGTAPRGAGEGPRPWRAVRRVSAGSS